MQRISGRTRMLLLAAFVAMASACAGKSDADSAAMQRLADREAIESTLQRYIRGLDHLDADVYAGSFAPDGVLVIDGSSRQGREAMRAVITQESALRQAMKDRGEPPRTLFHMEANSVVEVQGPDHAHHSAYWLTMIRTGKDPEGLSALGVGSSTDELQKIDGQWLITRRDIRLQP